MGKNSKYFGKSAFPVWIFVILVLILVGCVGLLYLQYLDMREPNQRVFAHLQQGLEYAVKRQRERNLTDCELPVLRAEIIHLDSRAVSELKKMIDEYSFQLDMQSLINEFAKTRIIHMHILNANLIEIRCRIETLDRRKRRNEREI